MATAKPKDSLSPGIGLPTVATAVAGIALVRSKRYAEPASDAPVLSRGVPTITRVPEMPTEVPNASLIAGVGLFRWVTNAGGEVPRSKTYARPESGRPVSFSAAPTTMRLPEIATALPKCSINRLVGAPKVSVPSGMPLVKSYTYTAPAPGTPNTVVLGRPTTSRCPDIASALAPPPGTASGAGGRMPTS